MSFSPNIHQILTVILISAGLKNLPSGKLPKADLYIDCRGIPNPHKVKEFQAKTGDASDLQAWVKDQASADLEAFEQQILSSFAAIPYRRLDELKPFERPYVICTLCAYGVHRSVAVKHILAERLKGKGVKSVTVM